MPANVELLNLLDAAEELELNLSRIYRLFADASPEDAAFWQQLALEEARHAALLRSIREAFVPRGLYPPALIFASLTEMTETNLRLKAAVVALKQQPLKRHDAFAMALALERQSGEACYQRFLQASSASTVDRVFRELNAADQNHAERLERYAAEQGIQL